MMSLMKGQKVYNAIAKFYERILKDTNRQINIHRDFFENFSDITSVNILGHSMSNVDLPYFQSVQLHQFTTFKYNSPFVGQGISGLS